MNYNRRISEYAALVLLSFCFFSSFCGAENLRSPLNHAPDTQALIDLVEHNSDLKSMLQQSIQQAAVINPNKESNPAQSLEEYYDFLDWAATAMPFNILPSADTYPKLYESIDQSLDYFYFLIDQPLEELEDKGYYHNSVQYVEPFRSWMIVFTKRWGDFLNTPASWNDEFYKRAYADSRFGLDKGWYESPENWSTFNQFFSRYLKSPDVRPIDSPEDGAVVVSPADSTPQGVWDIDENSRLIGEGVAIKSSIFNSIPDLIGPESSYRDVFASGKMTHTFLDVNDYHRYHFPVSGVVKEMKIILADDAVGGTQVWSDELKKYVLNDSIPGWQMIETRACIIVDTGEFGLVAVLPIGMSQVSSVNYEPTLKVGDTIKKGDPLGYFLFGGSDIVMIFQPEADFQFEVPEREDGKYTHLLMGEKYGTMHP
jgi:phosphatidylserine decarboxylase precursor